MATQFKRPSTFAGAATKQRSPRVRVGPMRQLFMSSLRGGEPASGGAEATAPDVEGESVEDILPRFPIVRQGYDCPVVDECIAELERDLAEMDRELAEVRAQVLSPEAVHRELQRIGEQTSSVLIAAHEQRDEILRTAQEEAERSAADAAAKASALTSKAEAQLRDIKAQKEAIQAERDRLLEEVRRVSAALAELGNGVIAG